MPVKFPLHLLLYFLQAHYVDTGTNGRASDGGVWRDCSLNRRLQEDTLNIPPPAALPNSDTILPYHLIADDAFPLKSYIMKPFPHRNIEDDQAIYNYRLSRGRRLIGEHSYVIMLYAK